MLKASFEYPQLWITLGPSSIDVLPELIRIGITGVRLTFSFGNPELQHGRAQAIRTAADQAGKRVWVVADLAGEKTRLGEFEKGASCEVVPGATFGVAAAATADIHSQKLLPINDSTFVAGLRVNDVFWIGDGAVRMRVTDTSGAVKTCTVEEGYAIDQKRGVVLEGKGFSPKALTETDLAHLRHVAAANVYDAVALSFVDSAQTVEYARSLMAGSGRRLPVVSKIETQSGVDRIAEIAAVSECVMAARGDLALAVGWNALYPAVQRIASVCNASNTPWILATQCAEGVEAFANLTRAEICDLAHWMEMGALGCMLSRETVFGRKPVESALACVRLLGGTDR